MTIPFFVKTPSFPTLPYVKGTKGALLLDFLFYLITDKNQKDWLKENNNS